MTKPGRKIITGDVDARASEASVALNQPATPTEPGEIIVDELPKPFFFREIAHTRVSYVRRPEGIVREGVQLMERISEGGEWPQELARFQGVGSLQANVPGQGQITRGYRFDIPATNLEQAWENFDESAKRGAVNAEREFRAQLHAAMQAQAHALAVPAPGQAARILDASGRPMS